ncbi:hypothetical protein LguiB_022230 [Lonicera macranthoides]
MESPLALLVLFSLLLIASTTYARPDPSEYWRDMMKDQQMPEAIQGLVNNAANKKSDCHTSVKAETSDKLKGEKSFVKDFEPRPNVSAYDGDDKKLSKENKSFVNDFEPRPNISSYNNGAGLKGGDDKKLSKENKSFVNDFEPRPNVSSYNNGAGLKGEKAFDEDFEPRPNVSVYQN